MPNQDASTLYFDDEDNREDLIAQIPEPHRARYEKFGHNRVESAFKDRVFIVFKAAGKNGSPASDVEVIDLVRVTSIDCDFEAGFSVQLENQKGVSQVVSYVPNPLFEYRIFVSIPPKLLLRWDAREHNGITRRSISCAILIKTRNKADFRSVGNLYMETRKTFRRLFPKAANELRI